MMAHVTAIEHRRVKLAPLLLGLLLAGCAQLPPLPDVSARNELGTVPFFPQTQYHCGPAALATLLVRSGVQTTPEAVSPYLYVPDRHGSLQAEMVAANRRFGRVPYLLDGGLEAVVAEIDAGRPVVVLQNLGVSWYPRWHYAVVIGYDGPRDEILLRSGVTERYVVERARFIRTWRRAAFWAMVVLRPGELPARPDERRYFETNAALEATGSAHIAEQGYRAMLSYWPQSIDARFGLGNLRLAEGKLAEARSHYQDAIDLSGGEHLGAANNLAMAWLNGRCATKALDVANDALAKADAADPLFDALRETRDEARAALDLAEDVCDADQL